MYYCKTRYYVPEWCRWLSADSVKYLDPKSLNGLNLYAYCGNNPVMGYDPMGTWDWKKFWNITAAVGVILLVTAATVATAGGAAVLLGASSAVVSGVVFGGVAGGLVAGGISLANQTLDNGVGNYDLWDLGESTFVGSLAGSISGAFGTLSSGVGSATNILVQKGIQAGFNMLLSQTFYLGHSLITGQDIIGFEFMSATIGGFISGATFNTSTGRGIGISIGLEIAGNAEDYYLMLKEKLKEAFD